MKKKFEIGNKKKFRSSGEFRGIPNVEGNVDKVLLESKNRIKNNENKNRYWDTIKLKKLDESRFSPEYGQKDLIHSKEGKPGGKLAGQKETAKSITKDKIHAFFGKGNYKNNPPIGKGINQKQVKSKKITSFFVRENRLNKARDEARKVKIEKRNQRKKERKLKQEKLKKSKMEAREKERKAKQIKIERHRQEKLELAKEREKTRKIKRQKVAKSITKDKIHAFFGKGNYKNNPPIGKGINQKQVKSKKITSFFVRENRLNKARDEARKVKIEKRNQRNEERKLKQEKLKKSKMEAREKERKAKQIKIERHRQEKLELAKEREKTRKVKREKVAKSITKDKIHAFFGKREKTSLRLDSVGKEKLSLRLKNRFPYLKTSKVKQSNRQARKAFAVMGRVSKKRSDSKIMQLIPSNTGEEKPDMLPIPETEMERIPDDEISRLQVVERLKSDTFKKLDFIEKGSWEELDFYPLMEPFAYAEIIQETKTFDKRYIFMEMELSDEERRYLEFIKETLGGFTVDTFELESKGEYNYLMEKVEQIIKDYMLKIGIESKKKIIYFLRKEFLGLGKLEMLMKDPNIEDISCDGSNVPIFLYHRGHGSLKSNVKFEDEEELSDFVVKLSQKCGKHISIANPMLDATMPDGSRIQMTLSTEVTSKGSTFTIRKFKEKPFSPADLIEFNTMSAEMVAYMWMAVENGINALFAGGTASGKTTSLNAISLFIPREAKVVSIEETREINLPHPNWIPGVSRSGFGEVVGDKIVGEIDMYDLMKAALRQRPEYILVGEIRGREAYVLFQAMATGHTTYSTAHADSARSLIHRLESKPINIPRIMLQSLDVVCIQGTSSVRGKRARRCKQVIEIIDIDPVTQEILTNEVFRWDPVEDNFSYSGKSYILERIRTEKDLSSEEIANELKNRTKLLKWMREKNVKDFRDVATMIANYAEDSLKVMKEIEG